MYARARECECTRVGVSVRGACGSVCARQCVRVSVRA